MAADDLPRLTFADADAWDAWLREHHATAPGVWVQFAKRASGIASVGSKEAVPVALAWGWIDGQARPFDADYWLVRYTPRRARSNWSKVNVRYVEALEAAGGMHPAGQAQVDAARADGRWEAAYASSASREVPPELQAALDASPVATAAYAELGAAARYHMTYTVQTVKRAETKARHVARFIAQLEGVEPPAS